MKESTFWANRLRPLLLSAFRDSGVPHHFERVENGAGVGTPDVDYCAASVAGKIELKYATRHPARPTTRVLAPGKGLRRSQVIWMAKRLRAGGVVFVAVGTPRMTWLLRVPHNVDIRAFAMWLEEAGPAMLDRKAVWRTGDPEQALVNTLTTTEQKL